MRPARDPALNSAPQAACTLLVLRSLDEPLAKRYALDDAGKLVKHAYQNAYRFMPDPVQVSGLSDLYRLIRRLERDPYSCIVRGELANPGQWRTKREPIRRLLHPSQNQITGEMEAAALCAHPQGQPWLMVDMDGVPTPQDMDVASDPLAALRYARSLLPDWLADTECVYQWSASAGVDGFVTLRLHLFFWLSQRRPDLSLERYFTRLLTEQGLPVDPAVCRPVQIHYTSAPMLGDGVRPFLPFARSGILPGAQKLAHPPAEILDAGALLEQLRQTQLVRRINQERRAAQQALGLVQAPQSRRLRAYARGALVHSAERLRAAPTGLRHATLLREALGLARLVGADLLDEDEVLELLHTVGAQILTDRSDPTREIEDIWEWAHPRGVTSPFLPEELEELEPGRDKRGAEAFVDAWRDVVPLSLADGREAVRELIAHGVRAGGGHCIAASPSLGKSFAAIEEAILPLAIQGGKIKLLLPSNNLLDEKRSEILAHADRWLEDNKLTASDYNDLVDLIQKFPTRNRDNCENFMGYQAADRVQPQGGKRYCHICSKREECEALGFLKQAKEASQARILLTTPHLEAQLAGQNLALWRDEGASGPEPDEPCALPMPQGEVVVLWQKIAEQLAQHPDAGFVPHTHRTPTRIEVSIRPAARGGAMLPAELEEHVVAREYKQERDPAALDEDLDEESADNEQEQDWLTSQEAVVRYRWSATGRELMRRWLIAQHGGWGGERSELVELYQNPNSWEWDALIIDEDPTGAMHVTLETSCHQLVHLFASGELVAVRGVQEKLTGALTIDQGEQALAQLLAGSKLHQGLHDASLGIAQLAQLAHACQMSEGATRPYVERLIELSEAKRQLEAESLAGAMGQPPATFVWDEVLLEGCGLLVHARLLERCARAGFMGCKLTRTGLTLHMSSPAEEAWVRICKAGHPVRMLEVARSLPDWRVAPALIAASLPTDGTAFEGCWVHKGNLHIPQIRRIDTTQARSVLYLDGTADPVTAQAVVPGCHWHPVVLQRPKDMEVVQVQLCATWQKITESKPMMRRWALTHAMAEMSHPGATLHITHKRLNQQVERELSATELADMPSASARRLLGALAKPDHIIHHGSSLARGSNQWEQARCVVLDAWRVPQHAVAERARVLARLAGVTREQALASARFALEGQGVIQEIHRARPLLGNTTVFVLDDRELPGLVPDQVWSMDQLDLRVYQLSGHLPHHHTFVTTELVRQAVHYQGGLVLGDTLLDIDETLLVKDAWLREGLGGGFAEILVEELPLSPSRLSQTVRHLVEERLGGSWTKLAQALELDCVRVRSSLQNREVLLLMPPEHTAGDVLRLMGSVPGWSWCAFGDEHYSKDDPAQVLDAWLTSCKQVRWDSLPGQLARSVLVRNAREAGLEASHPRLSWAMRALGLGIGALRERWRALHGVPDEQLGFEQLIEIQAVVKKEEKLEEDERIARLVCAAPEAERPPVHALARMVLGNYNFSAHNGKITLMSAIRDEQGWSLASVALDSDVSEMRESIYAGETPILEHGAI